MDVALRGRTACCRAVVMRVLQCTPRVLVVTVSRRARFCHVTFLLILLYTIHLGNKYYKLCIYDAPRRFFRRKVGGFGRVCHRANCTDFVKIQLPYFDEPPLVGS